MANTTGYYGVIPYGPQKDDAVMEFPVDASSGALYYGDLVQLVADNGVSNAAATNEDNLGICVGFLNGSGLPVPYLPLSPILGEKALVNIDPYQLYQTKCLAALTAANVGDCADHTVATGDADSGRSGSYIADVTGSHATATFRILGLVPRAGNAWGAYQDIVVLLNDYLAAGPAGI